MSRAPIYPSKDPCPNCPIGHRGCVCFRVPMYRDVAARGRPEDIARILKASGLEPPSPPPDPTSRAGKTKAIDSREIPRAHPSQLTDEQREAVATCSHRGVGQACCGPVDVCDLGRGWGRNGRRIDTGICCGCVLAGRNKDPERTVEIQDLPVP